jgi:hypothetical protein
MLPKLLRLGFAKSTISFFLNNTAIDVTINKPCGTPLMYPMMQMIDEFYHRMYNERMFDFFLHHPKIDLIGDLSSLKTTLLFKMLLCRETQQKSKFLNHPRFDIQKVTSLIYITVYNRFPNLLVFVSCVDYFQ